MFEYSPADITVGPNEEVDFMIMRKDRESALLLCLYKGGLRYGEN